MNHDLSDASCDLESNDSPVRLSDVEKQELKFYDFSKSYRRNNHIATTGLLDALADIKAAIDDDGHNARTFTGPVIPEFISLNVILNERTGIGKGQSPAPVFRPQPRRNMQPIKNQRKLSNVVQVLDLHFLYCNGLRFSGDFIEAAIFGETFDFDKAELFAITRGTTSEKLEALNLHNDHGPRLSRLGCASLKTDCDRENQLWLKKTPDRFMNKLRDKPLRGVVDRSEWADLLTADGLLKRLKIEPTNNALSNGCSLMGRFVSNRPSEHKKKLNSAKKAISMVGTT